MKKLILKLMVLTAILSLSCSEENISTMDESEEIQIMNFDSETEMQNKIKEIVLFKKSQEHQILEKILKKNKLKAPNATVDLAPKINNQTLDKEEIVDALTFYHTERLKSIYEERASFNFTSIQSIADEINSLKLLNPEKAEILYDKHSSVLRETKFGVTTLFDSEKSNILNVRGTVNVNNEIIIPNKSSKSSRLKEGIVVSDDIYAITYHAGVVSNESGFPIFSQLGSYVKLNGVFVLYPSWFYTDTSFSKVLFFDSVASEVLFFPAGVGNLVRNNGPTFIQGTVRVLNGRVSGTFTTPIANTLHTISGSVTFD